MDYQYWFPAARLQLMLLASLWTLMLKAREDLLQAISDIEDGATAKAILRDTYPGVNRNLALDTIEVMRWGLGELGSIMADLGIREHNQAFAPVARRLQMGYEAQTAEDVAQAFSNRRQYLPNLTDTVWGSANQRDQMLAGLLDVVDGDSTFHAYDIAGAMEEMWKPVQDGPRWAWSRMFAMDPKDRLASSKFLLPSDALWGGKVRGQSYYHLRLARTEIAGLQQEMAKQRYMQQPWVEGVDWTLSPGHPLSDICDDLADRNPWKTENVPGIPHPNCLCVLVPVLMDEDKFADRANAWLDNEDDFLDDYTEFLGDRSFLEHYPMPDSGKMSQWAGAAKGLPKAPKDLMALSKVNKWSPTVEVSPKAAAAWDKVKDRVAGKTVPTGPTSVPPPVVAPIPPPPLYAMNADEAMAYLRKHKASNQVSEIQLAISKLDDSIKTIGTELTNYYKYDFAHAATYEDAIAESAKIIDRQTVLQKQIAVHNLKKDKILSDLREEVLTPEPMSNMQVKKSVPKSWKKAEKELANSKMDQGARDIQRMVKIPEGEGAAQIKNIRTDNSIKRSSHQPRPDGSSNLFMDKNVPVSTHIHEWGHMVEMQDRNKLEKSINFLHQRTKDDKKMMRLKDVPGYSYYHPSEISMIDKFQNAYTGRIYSFKTPEWGDMRMVPNPMPQALKSGPYLSSSEISSMGLQAMYQNPIKFMTEDEGFFRFIWTEIMDR